MYVLEVARRPGGRARLAPSHPEGFPPPPFTDGVEVRNPIMERLRSGFLQSGRADTILSLQLSKAFENQLVNKTRTRERHYFQIRLR